MAANVNPVDIKPDLKKAVNGFGSFKVALATLLTVKIVLDLATFFEYPPVVIEELSNAASAGLLMIRYMEERGQIEPTSIMTLLCALKKMCLSGIEMRVRKLYVEHTGILCSSDDHSEAQLEGASSAASPINVKETLNSINPLDLQYVYRFACGLNKSAADIIIKYLQETEKGRPFAIICMLEHEEKSDQFQQSVKDLVSSNIFIRSYDAKLLQRSTKHVLEIASAKQIPISCVYLEHCSPRVDESGLNLILQSGLSLPILSSLQKLQIYDHNRRLTNKEFAAILSYSSQCTSLKELQFGTVPLGERSRGTYFLPETIPVTSIPSSLKSRNVKVWNYHPSGHRRLNLQTGRWQFCDAWGNLPGEEGFDEWTYRKA